MAEQRDATAAAPREPTSAPGSAQGSAQGVAATGFVRHAMLVSAMTLLSRFTGLARDAVLAAMFSLGAVADAFFLGFLVPNLFRRLFGEGALTAAFIPQYTELLRRDTALAQRFASLCLALLAVTLAGITLLGEVALAAMLTADWSDNTALAIRLTMWMLPYMPLVCLVALLGGILHVHGRFGPPAAAPVVLNLVMIGFALGAGMLVDGGGAPLARVALWIAVGVLAAGMLQLLWQALAIRRHMRFSLNFAGTAAPLRTMLATMLPMLLGLAVFQINAFTDSLIAYGLSATDERTHLHLLGWTLPLPIETGSVAALQWAQRLYQFPLGVFGIAVATAIFPALARAATADAEAMDGKGDRFATILRHGLQLTVFIGLPASVGLILLRLPLTRLIYERGAFETADAERVAMILAGYATSVWAYSMMHVLTRAFYARQDARTPLRIGMAVVALNLALNLTLIWPLGAAGLAWSTAISAMVQVVCLLLAIRRYVDRPIDAAVARSWARTAILSLFMAALLMSAMWMLDVAAMNVWQTTALLAALTGGGAAVVLGGAWLSGGPELRWLIHRDVR